ncbi:MAG: 50S ribosomal protein L25/general stress protein Ctc [Rhodospirillaceae bacterium]|jgi:large subunit ribosomal protein L25|nr:50S ribosomal protein L25/general stress protein Ctc [Rhodospirillaceae bacterium]
MAEIQTILASSRVRAGKGTARAARREGQIPAVIYGNNENPILITLDKIQLEQEMSKNGFFIRLIDVEVEGKKHRVLPRDTQFHPVTDQPLHVDFLRYSADRRLTVEVPVQFLNENDSPGLKTGGVLNVVRHAIEISCIADSIPEMFEVDLTGLEVGDSIHASTLSLSEGVELTISDRDFTIATIAAPTILTVEEDVAETDGEDAGEGSIDQENEDTETDDDDKTKGDD